MFFSKYIISCRIERRVSSVFKCRSGLMSYQVIITGERKRAMCVDSAGASSTVMNLISLLLFFHRVWTTKIPTLHNLSIACFDGNM